MKHTVRVVLGVLMLASAHAVGAPNLFVNGSLVAQSPAAGNYSDISLFATGQLQFTLLFESTSYSNRNTLYLHNWGSNNVYQTIFDDNESAGATRSFNLNGQYGFSLLSDVNDNGNYNGGSNGDRWLFSDRDYTRPNNLPDDDYQFFRAYNTSSFGNANYRFENGNLQFSGDYDFLLFIDDRQDGYGNYDHNDMVVGGRFVTNDDPSAVPEPTSLVLLGAGIAAVGAIRRKFRK